MAFDLIPFILNMLIILFSIAGGVLLIGTLYRGYRLLGLLIAEKKHNSEKKHKIKILTNLIISEDFFDLAINMNNFFVQFYIICYQEHLERIA